MTPPFRWVKVTGVAISYPRNISRDRVERDLCGAARAPKVTLKYTSPFRQGARSNAN